MAERVYQSIRELEGCLNRVIAYATLTQAPITLELAAQANEDIATKQPDNAITPELVIETVANSLQLNPADLKSQKQHQEIALARQVAMYLIREKTTCSLAQIGQALGGKNPATVSHAVKKITKDVGCSPFLKRRIQDINQKLLSNNR
jgi:chromosomal replication initiator protein